METDAQTVETTSKFAKKGLAPAIRSLALKYPEMSKADIAKRVGCHVSNVKCILSRFLSDHSEEDLRQFQESKADIYDALALRTIGSITDAKLEKMPARDAFVSIGILHDKSALLRGQPTSINFDVMADLAEAIRAGRELPASAVAPSVVPK